MADEQVELKAELEKEHDVEWLSEDTRNLMWSKAWEDGHSYGLQEVRNQYHDLAEIAVAAALDG